MIISKTPFRISFFGGGTDYPPWFREFGGSVLSTTIDKYCYISGRYLPPFFEHRYRVVYSKIETVGTPEEIQHPAVRAALAFTDWNRGLEIHHDGDLPARSGLGSSSSFTVGMLNVLHALRGNHASAQLLAEQAIHVEQDIIGEPVGSQDQIAAAYGGLNRIDFHPDGSFEVAPLIAPEDRLETLQDHLMLFFTGVSRYSSDIAASKIKNFAQRRQELSAIGAMVDEAIGIIQSPDTPITEFGRLLHETWQQKRRLSERVSSQQIDEMYRSALEAGAIGGKITGAGGGGFLLLFVPPQRQAHVRQRLDPLIHVPIRFERSGSHIVLYQPNGFH